MTDLTHDDFEARLRADLAELAAVPRPDEDRAWERVAGGGRSRWVTRGLPALAAAAAVALVVGVIAVLADDGGDGGTTPVTVAQGDGQVIEVLEWASVPDGWSSLEIAPDQPLACHAWEGTGPERTCTDVEGRFLGILERDDGQRRSLLTTVDTDPPGPDDGPAVDDGVVVEDTTVRGVPGSFTTGPDTVQLWWEPEPGVAHSLVVSGTGTLPDEAALLALADALDARSVPVADLPLVVASGADPLAPGEPWLLLAGDVDDDDGPCLAAWTIEVGETACEAAPTDGSWSRTSALLSGGPQLVFGWAPAPGETSRAELADGGQISIEARPVPGTERGAYAAIAPAPIAVIVEDTVDTVPPGTDPSTPGVDAVRTIDGRLERVRADGTTELVADLGGILGPAYWDGEAYVVERRAANDDGLVTGVALVEVTPDGSVRDLALPDERPEVRLYDAGTADGLRYLLYGTGTGFDASVEPSGDLVLWDRDADAHTVIGPATQPEYGVHAASYAEGRIVVSAFAGPTEVISLYPAEAEATAIDVPWDPTRDRLANVAPMFVAARFAPDGATVAYFEGPQHEFLADEVVGSWVLVVRDTVDGAERLRLDLGVSGDPGLVSFDYDGTTALISLASDPEVGVPVGRSPEPGDELTTLVVPDVSAHSPAASRIPDLGGFLSLR